MKNTTLIFGLRTVIEAIQAEKSLEKVYLQKGLSGNLFSELFAFIKQKNISYSFVPVEKLNHLAKNKNHQGAVAKIAAVGYKDLEAIFAGIKKDKPLILLLDQITDVRNFGAILRTAECTGVDAVVIPQQGSAPLNAEAVKTSAGAAFNIPVCKVNHLLDAIYFLQAEGIEINAITEKTSYVIYDVNFNKPTALILGSEHRGISPGVLKLADNKARLPMLGGIDSLNVSVACGVALYEVVRQRL